MSAGDGMAKFLSDCDNVTLMGITASGGVNQNNGACIYLTNNISVCYPAFLTLSYEGVPLIDTDNTRQTRVPLDEKIPMTKEFALRFFDPEKLRNPEAGDPQLDYAVDYMARKTASGKLLKDSGPKKSEETSKASKIRVLPIRCAKIHKWCFIFSGVDDTLKSSSRCGG